MAAADLNNDGAPDLISANFYANTLTILTNNGSGAFGSNATLTVGAGPFFVGVADLNGDGKPDLVTANNTANTLTVLTNNGSGVFGLSATLSVGSAPNFVAVADLNGDGKPDLISANFNDSTLTILLNNGNGAFTRSGTVHVGFEPYGVAAGDVNGDGKTDLISVNGVGTFSVLTNATGMVSGEITAAGQIGGLRFVGAPGSVLSVIDGAAVNSVDTGVGGAVIAGGGTTNFQGSAAPNRVSADYGSIGGGNGNSVQPVAVLGTIAGGSQNSVSGYAATVSGGSGNTVGASYSTISGGRNATIQAGADDAFIGGRLPEQHRRQQQRDSNRWRP